MASQFIYKLSYSDKSLSSQVYSFGEQLLHVKLKFTACDLFSIDMELFYMVVCSASTYLMILLQVDGAYRQQQDAQKT